MAIPKRASEPSIAIKPREVLVTSRPNITPIRLRGMERRIMTGCLKRFSPTPTDASGRKLFHEEFFSLSRVLWPI